MESQPINNTVLNIGKYRLWEIPGTDRIWIGLDDGEGGSFPIDSVEKIIGEYYGENF